MTKCICGGEISPASVKDHQGCGNKVYFSEVTLSSINQMVAENKQRFIKFPFTPEVVDFLLESIDGLTTDREEWKDSCCDANKRFQIAEVEVDGLENQRHQLIATRNLALNHLEKAEAENAALTKENKALNTEKVGMIASLDALGTEVERLKLENSKRYDVNRMDALTKKVEVLREALLSLRSDKDHFPIKRSIYVIDAIINEAFAATEKEQPHD